MSHMEKNWLSLIKKAQDAPVKIWMWFFFELHMMSTLPWENLNTVAWVVSVWLFCVGAAIVITFGVVGVGVSSKSLLSIMWGAYFAVWLNQSDDIFNWAALNAQYLRLWVAGALFFVGWVVLVRGRRAFVQRMWLVGGVGVLGLQLLHAGIFNLSYESRESLLREEHAMVLSYQSFEAVQQECKRRKWLCLRGGESDVRPPDFKATKYNVHTAMLGQAAMREAMRESQKTTRENVVTTWTWHDEWEKQPNGKWPAMFSYTKKADGSKWLVIDAMSLVRASESHVAYFSWLSSIGGVAWLLGAMMVARFHQRRWDRKLAKPKQALDMTTAG